MQLSLRKDNTISRFRLFLLRLSILNSYLFDKAVFSDDTADLSRNADNDGFQVSDRREWPINRWLLCAINYLIERFSTYHADKNERRECITSCLKYDVKRIITCANFVSDIFCKNNFLYFIVIVFFYYKFI